MKQLKKAFGINEYGMPDIPVRFSGVKISRITKVNKVGGCSFCFPHGIDLINSRDSKFQRSWKKHRKNQYR